ncbi:MAG: V-type ATPase subunit [Lachnospiraceae bacterium]|nr:V-type ATPase subunit [Lachnospiraceae bacterium]
MTDNHYYYAVARIRSRELSLLNQAFIDQLLGARSMDEAMRLLQDKGWHMPDEYATESDRVEKMLSTEKQKTWDLMEELVSDTSVFDVLLIENDYHNLKAAVKEALTSDYHPEIFSAGGTIDPKIMEEAVKTRDYGPLPDEMEPVAQKALETLLHTHDGQLTDVIIDKAALIAIGRAAKKSGSPVLELYAKLKVASADIKIAIRAVKTGKDKNFIKDALAPCDTLDTDKLAEAASEGMDAIYDYLALTPYSDAIPELKKSPSAFERWCDNLIIRNIRSEIAHPYTIGPLAAYIIARENEISTVRIVLSGLINDLPEESVRERAREMYV